MPILEIKALPQKNKEKIPTVLKKTAVAIANAYGCKPEQVWVTWNEFEPGFYVEGENEAHIQPERTHPPIATLTCFEGKADEQIEKILKVAAATLSETLGIPSNIFITYIEAKSGRVIAGNGVIRK